MSRQTVMRRQSHIRPLPQASGHFLCLKRVGAAAIAAVMAAGCSADISRFDGQGYGLTDNSSTKIPQQGMRRGEPARLSEPVPDGDVSPGGAYYPPASGANGNKGAVRTSALPDPVPASPPQSLPPQTQRPMSIAPRPAISAVAQAKPISPGATIEVVHGDTLYGIAKKHAVPVNELMTVNNLTTPNLKPGQKLVLPASRSIARAPTPQKPIQRASAPPRIAAIPASAAAPIPTDWQGTHAVKSGESLYGIARANRISLAQLQQVNGIADATKVKPGTVLKIPASTKVASNGDGAVVPPLPQTPPPATAAKVAGASASTESPRMVQTPTKPLIINTPATPAPQQMAAVEPTTPAVEPSPKANEMPSNGGAIVAGHKFRWPVKGRVIASYGPRNDSTHNDGINIAVPMGTEVLAAEQGVVAYAGSELKGYGNLILLRHDNGWVTAYAHNEEVLVKRGDKVKRGQSIAKAGKTGTVDQPQVHFEIRQGQKPIDPMPHLEKL